MTRTPAVPIHTFALTVAALFLALPAAAHDLWIEAADWTPRADQTVAVELRVGTGFAGEAVARRGQRIERFAVLGPGGESPLPGVEGAHPAALLRPREAGDHVLVYRSTESPITLEAEPFEAYLVEEGLEHVSRLRAERGESDEPGRELFSRSVKALVSVRGKESETEPDTEPEMAPDTEPDPAPTTGAANAASAHLRPAELALELIPEAPPADLAPGDDLSLRLLWQGEPLAGALVRSAHRAAGPRQRLRTDAAGRVTVALDEAGVWKLATVHMEAVPDAAAPGGADWRSVWTSLVFCVRPAGAALCDVAIP